MKKLSILIALLVVATFAFAQTVEFDGDATLTVGFDLDTEQFGFKNEASSELSVTWTFDDAAAGGTAAFINLTDMELAISDADGTEMDAPTVEAGLIFAPLTITIYSAPDLAFDNAEGFKFTPDDPDDPLNVTDPALTAASIATAATAGTVEYVWIPTADLVGGETVIGTVGTLSLVEQAVAGDAAVAASFQGLTVTADVAPLTITLMLASDGTWVENTENAVAIGAVVAAAIDPLTVEAGVIYGPTSDAELGATVGVGAAVGPATVDVGFDFFESNYDASVEIGVDLGVASLTSLTYLTGGDGIDLEMYEQVVVDASAAVDGLTFVNTTQLDTILATDALRWYNGTDLAYDLGGIEPFALVEVYDIGADLDLDLELGVTLTGQIELTTFTLKWAADSLIGAESLGAITFATKIEY